MNKRFLLRSMAGGTLAFVLLFVLYWLKLLLNHRVAFIPNAQLRIAMYKSLRHGERGGRGHQDGKGSRWRPQQGDHWIF